MINRTVSDLGAFLITGFIIPLDDRDELEVTCFQLVAEKAVYVEGMLAVDRINRTQDVEFHIVLLHQPYRPDHLIEHRFSALVVSVGIMQMTWSSKAEPDEKIVLMEKFAPLLIDQNADCLQGVFYTHTGLYIFLLHFNGTPVKIEAHERRLPALPGDRHFRHPVSLDGLTDIGFHHLIRHPEITIRVQPVFFEEKAVVALQVALRARGFGHHMECLQSGILRIAHL